MDDELVDEWFNDGKCVQFSWEMNGLMMDCLLFFSGKRWKHFDER